MRLGPDQVGPRGWLLIAATGLVGIGLAVHGYGRGSLVVATGIGVPGGSPAATAPPSSTSVPATAPGTTAASPTTANPSSPTKAGPVTTSTAPSQQLGPLLSSTQYAHYAYQVYPGQESSQARLATAGFTIRVTPQGGKISLSISATGSGQAAQTATYPAGDKVYFIEATFGDDSGSSDYSFGDDGVVVTNPQGYLVQ